MSLPLSAFPIASTSDPDEAQSILSRELSDLRFQSVQRPRDFQLEMNGVRLGNTLLAFNKFETETKVYAGVIDHAVIVSFCIGAPSILNLDGESVGPDLAGVTSPSRKLTVDRSAGSGVLLLRAGCDTLEERIREMTGRVPDEPIVFDRSVSIDAGVGAHLRRLIARIIHDTEADADLLSNPLLRTGLDEMLLNTMLALPHNFSSLMLLGESLGVGQRLVRRAEEYLEAHASDAITISDVVAECGCSRRALFNAFRRYRGYTPMQFLAESRLHSARRALLESSSTDSVASIAKACGFFHMGRFSIAYRKRFGETPSTTLRTES